MPDRLPHATLAASALEEKSFGMWSRHILSEMQQFWRDERTKVADPAMPLSPSSQTRLCSQRDGFQSHRREDGVNRFRQHVLSCNQPSAGSRSSNQDSDVAMLSCRSDSRGSGSSAGGIRRFRQHIVVRGEALLQVNPELRQPVDEEEEERYTILRRDGQQSGPTERPDEIFDEGLPMAPKESSKAVSRSPKERLVLAL